MKKIKRIMIAAVILAALTMLFNTNSMAALPECTITAAGYDSGVYYAQIAGHPIYPAGYYLLSPEEATAKVQLAVAMAAISSGKKVIVVVNSNRIISIYLTSTDAN